MKHIKRDTSRILIISDTHYPWHHPDTIEFLKAVKKKHKPTWIVHIGDEVDNHALSYHDHDPDLPSAGDELFHNKIALVSLFQLFPKVDVLHSNHGNLLDRKALTHGIPKAMLKSQRDIIGAPDGWSWHFDILAKLPTGFDCYFHHSKGSNVLLNAQRMGCSMVQGHHHESFTVSYYSTPTGLHFGMNVGCLVDQHSPAFAYSKNNSKRFIKGVGIIIGGVPQLVPMLLNSKGRWVGEL